LFDSVQIFRDEIADKWKSEAMQAARDELRKKREEEEKERQEEWEEWSDDSEDEEEEEEEEEEENESKESNDKYKSDEEKDNEESDEDEDEDESDKDEGKDKDKDEETESPERDKGRNPLARWPFFYVPRDESLMTSAMADYCIAELRHKAKAFGNSISGAIFVFNGDVVKSDKVVSSETKKALQQAVEPLENVPAAQKDWHPGSYGRVLDLVHPSLFPLVYGKSKVLDVGEKVVLLKDCTNRSGEGSVVPRPERPGKQTIDTRWSKVSLDPFSTEFQWLPCEVDITGDKPKYAAHDLLAFH
jgi:Protein of unknown function (DUF4246)